MSNAVGERMTESGNLVQRSSGTHPYNGMNRPVSFRTLPQAQSYPFDPFGNLTWVLRAGPRQHFSLDHLGTSRLTTASNGTFLATHHYYGFGEEIR